MKVERYMMAQATGTAATPIHEDDSPYLASGLSKLEWMAGQIAHDATGGPHESQPDGVIVDPDMYAKYIVNVAAAILKACHVAQEGSAQ